MTIPDDRFNKFCSLENEILTITHNSGFFSNCTISLYGIVTYFNHFRKMPEKIDFSQTFKNFRSKQNLNSYTDYFQPNLTIEIEYHNEINFRALSIFDYQLESFEQITPLIQRYFSPAEAVLQKVDILMKKWKVQPEKTIAVCYRGTDKYRDTGLATFEDFIEKAQFFQRQYPDYHILIQTDQAQFWDIAVENLKNIYRFSETPFTSSNKVMHEIISDEDKVEWTQWFVAATIVISRCAFIINHSGNVGRWICLYRQSANNMTQYLREKNSISHTDGHWLS